jgi:hypothetical protein
LLAQRLIRHVQCGGHLARAFDVREVFSDVPLGAGYVVGGGAGMA